MLIKSRYTVFSYLSLALVTCLLFFTSIHDISISYKEAINLYLNTSLLSILTKSSIFLFGNSDLALRLPFIIFYVLSVIFMYKITENYFRYEFDRFLSILIFMFLPGVLSAALLVNTAIIATFFTLLYLYYYSKYKKHLYFLLPFLLFIDNSFIILFLALAIFSFKQNDKKLLYLCTFLSILSILLYGLSTSGKPKGFFLDTFGIYAAIFSPILFLYFLYTIYRLAIKKQMDLSWYISATAIVLSIFVSFRQKVYIEDFAPYLVTMIPSMVKMFLNSYRVRLKEFRKTYNIMASLIVFFLVLNVFFTFFNKPLYLIVSQSQKHFVYQYHFAKELAYELKKRQIDEVFFDDSTLALRLKFYGIKEGFKYYLSNQEFYNYDEKIIINYYGRDLFTVYIKNLI